MLDTNLPKSYISAFFFFVVILTGIVLIVLYVQGGVSHAFY